MPYATGGSERFEDVLDLAVGKADFVLPALEQIL